MSILCKLGGHEAASNESWNAGYFFSSCTRCGCDMIRSGGGWNAVPAGHRVAWKKGFHRHSYAEPYRSNLPVLYSGATSR